MNIRDLQYLVALSQFKHFSKAADACFVSQPALSMQIKKLEDILGIPLLERINKTVLLTQAGEYIVQHAKNVLYEVDQIKAVAQAAKDPWSGEIRVGIFPTLGPYWLPKIMPGLTKAFPKLSFYLIEEKTPALLTLLNEGKIDAAFLAEPVLDHDLGYQSIFAEEFLLAVSKSNPLSQLSDVQSSDLIREKMLLLSEGHCLRDQALAICHQYEWQETKHFHATSLETLRYMVASGVGITLMPRISCYPTENIVYIPFSSSKPMRKIALYWRKYAAKQVVFEKIVEVLRLVK